MTREPQKWNVIRKGEPAAESKQICILQHQQHRVLNLETFSLSFAWAKPKCKAIVGRILKPKVL